MSYIDAFYNRQKDKVHVVERVAGQRIYQEFPARHVFYYSHPAGSQRSIFGDPCKKFETSDSRKFKRELGLKQSDAKVTIFESDIRPEFRILADRYKGAAAPDLNLCFFDIETGWDPVKRYAPTHDPFNPITAITLYLTSAKRNITLALCPPSLTMDEANAFASEFVDTIVFEDEISLADGIPKVTTFPMW
jgi:hypothetical protein